jgi:DNA-binding NarL/FixJ family response regulator
MLPLRLVIISDFELVKEGINSFLSSTNEVEIVQQFSNYSEVTMKSLLGNVDIIITDICAPQKNGIQLAKEINGQIPILVLSYGDNFDFFYQAIKLGVNGYLLRNCSKEEFLKALETIQNGEKYFSSKISTKLVTKLMEDIDLPKEQPKVKLTKREKGILTLAMKGMKSKDIGEALGISIRTVDKHRANIMDKCKVNNIVALIQFANKYHILN